MPSLTRSPALVHHHFERISSQSSEVSHKQSCYKNVDTLWLNDHSLAHGLSVQAPSRPIAVLAPTLVTTQAKVGVTAGVVESAKKEWVSL